MDATASLSTLICLRCYVPEATGPGLSAQAPLGIELQVIFSCSIFFSNFLILFVLPSFSFLFLSSSLTPSLSSAKLNYLNFHTLKKKHTKGFHCQVLYGKVTGAVSWEIAIGGYARKAYGIGDQGATEIHTASFQM